MRVAGLDLLHWINDGLMTFFFLLVGLEIKREMVEGQLDSWPRRALPLIAALGGMLVPALIFMAINFPHPENWRGWAMPTATDIAFALGVLALFGSRVPASLKVFLTSLAIIDDLGAILIIAIFYAADLSFVGARRRRAVRRHALLAQPARRDAALPYLLLGVMLWAAMLFSGIHATLAGVVLAMTIPHRPCEDGKPRCCTAWSRGCRPGSRFWCCRSSALPMPACRSPRPAPCRCRRRSGSASSAACFSASSSASSPRSFSRNRRGIAALPAGASWREIYGVAVLCGIGFTMSSFHRLARLC